MNGSPVEVIASLWLRVFERRYVPRSGVSIERRDPPAAAGWDRTRDPRGDVLRRSLPTFALVVEIVATLVLTILCFSVLVPIRIAAALAAFSRAFVASFESPRPKVIPRARAQRKISALAGWR